MISHTGESPAIVFYATMVRLMAYGTIIGLRLFTNNLFIIGKCTYATPDPVQPDQHYLRVHCVYPLCLFTHVPYISPANVTLLSHLNILPSYCQCPSPTAELPAVTL